jgi:hypothetical protein
VTTGRRGISRLRLGDNWKDGEMSDEIREFALHEGETWRDVVTRISAKASIDSGEDASDFVADCLKTFDAASKRRDGKDDRAAALETLHRWCCFPSTEHTPGPWSWAKIDGSTTMLLGEGQDPCCTSILIADGCKACADKGRNCSINGNSFDLSLISTATDILAALRRLLAKSKDMLERDVIAGWREGNELSEEVAQAETAMAKAEGQE